MNKKLLVIGGPTASGKTSLAIKLARHYQTDVVSADSRQVFREMSIGTAKPRPSEMAGVLHHLVDSRSITQPYSAGMFSRDAHGIIDEIFKTKEVVILTGGTGFYIQALLDGLDEFPDVPDKINTDLVDLFTQKGIEALQSNLLAVDPVFHNHLRNNKPDEWANPQRLIRFIGISTLAGKPYSELIGNKQRNHNWTVIRVALQMDRDALYARINQRVDQMMVDGLLDEVKSLLPFRDQKAMQTVGYQELFRYLDHEISLDKAIELIKRNTRRYAKRQMTWFRNQGDWSYFHPNQFEDIVVYVDTFARQSENT